MRNVPVYEAKNRFSGLLAAPEWGGEVSITRCGVAVAKLVSVPGDESADEAQRARVSAAFARLRQIRASLEMDGDLKGIAREGPMIE